NISIKNRINFSATAADTKAPFWNVSTWGANNTAPLINDVVKFSVNISDETQLNVYRFAHNQSGSFVNGSDVAIGAAGPYAANQSLTAAAHESICGMVWFNDSSGNQNVTNMTCYNAANTLPTAPVLSEPLNGSYTLINRTPTFNWSAATDADGDAITYEIIIDCKAADCGGYVDYLDVTGINARNYTSTDFLQVDADYNWTVRANDSYGYGSSSDVFNFSIRSVVSISLINSRVDFGSKSVGDKDNTSDNSPEPLVVQNDGTVIADVMNISAFNNIWNRSYAQMPSAYFQMKADNTTELYSFNWSGSITDWTNVAAANTTVVDNLHFNSTSNEVELDILIEVPGDEFSGQKATTLAIYGIETQ
ncbi:hypothetical protein J4209_03810, partial [Candidatus Woesearchaeota archaeon]|nr:hypothetical protein [Candidatus Woesearchaeota archaeon]